jgi:hypothetical protein
MSQLTSLTVDLTAEPVRQGFLPLNKNENILIDLSVDDEEFASPPAELVNFVFEDSKDEDIRQENAHLNNIFSEIAPCKSDSSSEQLKPLEEVDGAISKSI